MRQWLRCGAVTLLVFGVMTLAAAPPAGAANYPAGFTETTIVPGGLSAAVGMEIAPDGRIFVLLQGGAIRLIKNGSLVSTPFLKLSPSTGGTRGLLGIAFPPNFPTNPNFYVTYTAALPAPHNRLSRFTANGDTAAASSEVVLLDLPNTKTNTAVNHEGGDVHFGSDGKLYMTTGDNTTGSNSQSMTTLFGKMLRLNTDGSIPTDNPFYNTATGQYRLIWAKGLRNPWKFNVHPSTGKILISDVGADTWEELDVGRSGANYGWVTYEGPSGNPAYDDPLWAYQHDTGSITGCSIAGGDFYTPTNPTFPTAYRGKFLVTDYCAGWIYAIDSVSGAAQQLGTGLSGAIDLEVANDGSLWTLERGTGDSSVKRVQYSSGTATAPSITTHPSNVSVQPGQPATFTVVAAGTEPLAYQWQRNGTNISGATSASYTLASPQLADNGATFRVRVSNSVGSVTSNSATLTVSSNVAPTATITAPVEGTTYGGGQVINYSGTGSDPEDGTPPASAFTWRIDFHHDTHLHPFLPDTSGSKSGSFTVPTQGETSTNVWFRIHLTVKDSAGATSEAVRDVMPRLSSFRLETQPDGLKVTIDGATVTAPTEIPSVEGIQRIIGAPAIQTGPTANYEFASWSDGGAREHAIFAPATTVIYTATFTETTEPPGGAALLVVGNPTLSTGDTGVRDHLVALGYTVTVADDDVAAAGDATGTSLVLVSATVDPLKVGTKFRTVAVPVLTWEGWLFDDFGMTGGSSTSRGVLGSQTKVAIADSAHPLAGGLTATPTVYSSAAGLYWGNPNSNAARVATVVGQPSQAVVFGYDTGATMSGGNTAPARRVGFFLADNAFGQLTAQGVTLLDAALGWAAGGSAPPPPPPPPPPGGTALMVVGSPTLSTGDSGVRNRLVALGYTATVADDDVAAAADATGKSLVLVSATVDPLKVGTKFRAVAVPVLTWEAWLFDDFGMTGGSASSRGVLAGQTQVAIANTAHPLAGGLTGTQTVYSPAAGFNWGNPNSNAARVATVVGQPSQVVVFGYDTGATMSAGNTAPARRVGFFLAANAFGQLTAQGVALLDAAVSWAKG